MGEQNLPQSIVSEANDFLQQAKAWVAEYAKKSKAANTWKVYHSDFADCGSKGGVMSREQRGREVYTVKGGENSCIIA